MVTRLPAILLLAICFTAYAQHTDTTAHSYKQVMSRQMDTLKQMQAGMDTLQAQQLKSLSAEAMQRDSITMARNLNSYMQQQREQNERVKKQLWLKGGIFAMMLAVTVAGYIKRRKGKVQG